jgi:hypothetical protein
VSNRALEALDRILNRGGEPDDVLRAAVVILTEEPGITWAGVRFVDEGRLTPGPEVGDADESRRTHIPVTYQGTRVGELWVDGEAERAFLERVAVLVSAHVLIGWDTRGKRWEP